MSEAFDLFQAECKRRLEADQHYQMYLASARNNATRELIETIALCFYIEGRLDERGGKEYDQVLKEYDRAEREKVEGLGCNT